MNRLSLDALLTNQKQIYVKNTSKPKAVLIISFGLANGNTIPVKIPRTNLPICLNNRVGPDVIRNSHDLRAYLNKQLLELVDPVEAERILADPANLDELQSLSTSEFSDKNTMISPRVSEMSKIHEEIVSNQLNISGVPSDLISPRVLSIVARLETKDLQVKAALIELRTIEDDLSDVDCNYIVAKGPDGQIKQFAQNVLSKFATGEKLPPKPNVVVPSSETKSVIDDDDSDLTPEEKKEEARRAAAARVNQAV